MTYQSPRGGGIVRQFLFNFFKIVLKDKPVSSTSANCSSCKTVLVSPTRFVWLTHTFSGSFMGSRDGTVVRALASHQCGMGSILARCHMWVEFVVGSCPCSEGFFSRFSGFPPSTKTNTPNSNSTRIEDPHENQLRLMWLPL